MCRQKGGAPVQCSKKSCFAAFHVTCARDYGLTLDLRRPSDDSFIHKAFCHKHPPVCLILLLLSKLTCSKGRRRRRRTSSKYSSTSRQTIFRQSAEAEAERWCRAVPQTRQASQEIASLHQIFRFNWPAYHPAVYLRQGCDARLSSHQDPSERRVLDMGLPLLVIEA